MKKAFQEKIENDISKIISAGCEKETTVNHPVELFVFPENVYGPPSLFGCLHGGGLTGNITYAVTKLEDGILSIGFSGSFTYQDAIDMNAAAGDEFFCRWTDPMGGGHDYDFSATWGYQGKFK